MTEALIKFITNIPTKYYHGGLTYKSPEDVLRAFVREIERRSQQLYQENPFESSFSDRAYFQLIREFGLDGEGEK